MSTIDRAIQIAAESHAGVSDKQGRPYIFHPLQVMLGVQGEAAQIVGVLHDVVEDTDVTLDDIRREGFSEDVLEALQLVTHPEGQSYPDYIVACRANAIATQVKISDLRDNTRLDRTLMRPQTLARDGQRMQRYALSYRFLTDELSEAEYRQAMGHLS